MPRNATGPTRPRQFRLTDADLDALDAWGAEWGPVKPLTRTDVIRELIRREKARKKIRGKSVAST